MTTHYYLFMFITSYNYTLLQIINTIWKRLIVYISYACFSLTKAKQHHIKSVWKQIPVADKSFGIFTTDTNI